MGSWHATCNISQLPITPGTPVRVLFLGRCPYSMDPENEMKLGEGNNSREGCYSTDFWYPRTVPLKAVYDDYGCVRDVETGLALDILWKQLAEDLLEVPQGKNPYHDPPTAKGMNWDQMWDAATEGRLRVNGNYGSVDYGRTPDGEPDFRNTTPSKPRALPVCAVMIREDVFQAMLKLESPVHFFNRRKEDYERSEVENYVEMFTKTVNHKSVFHDPALARSEVGGFFRNMNPPFSLGLGFYMEELWLMVQSKTTTATAPEAQKLIRQLAEFAHIHFLFSALRKTWHPGTGCGSQSEEYEVCAQFHESVANIGYNLFEKDSQDRAEWDDEYTARKAKRIGSQ